MSEILTLAVAGQPLWMWLSFLAVILVLLWLDLGVFNRKDAVVSAGKSAIMWSMFASIAIGFGALIWFFYTPDPAFYPRADGNERTQAVIQYFTGYLLETALAFDNIFVMSLVFSYFAVPREYQHRVLFWGILGAIVFRALFIGLGTAVVNQFTWVLFIFAAFLIYTGVRMLSGGDDDEPDMENNAVVKFVRRLFPVTPDIYGRKFIKRLPNENGVEKLYATPLLLALISVEVVDIIFAVDSVPAILAVTQDPFIVYTSNIFAILGLRSMYFMLSAAVERFSYLKYGLALVLVLIGGKIVWNFGLSDGLGLVPHLEALWSLIATVTLLIGAICFSLWATRKTGAGSS